MGIDWLALNSVEHDASQPHRHRRWTAWLYSFSSGAEAKEPKRRDSSTTEQTNLFQNIKVIKSVVCHTLEQPPLPHCQVCVTLPALKWVEPIGHFHKPLGDPLKLCTRPWDCVTKTLNAFRLYTSKAEYLTCHLCTGTGEWHQSHRVRRIQPQILPPHWPDEAAPALHLKVAGQP